MSLKKTLASACALALLLLIAAAVAADPVSDLAMKQFREPIAPRETSAPGSLRVVSMVPTFLFTSEDGRLLQWATITLDNRSLAAIAGQVSACRPDKNCWTGPIKISPGKTALTIKVPDLRDPAGLIVTISAAGRDLASASYDWQPARQWTVYITHLSHFDNGYTGTQEFVRNKWDSIISTALKYTHETDNYPDDARFRYNLDAAYPLQMFMERHPDRIPEIAALVRAGRWDVNAKFAHICSSTTSPELLARELYYAKRDLEKLFDTTLTTAIHTDVPGITWADADVFAGAGIKYFLFHPNIGYRGAGVVINSKFPHAYYWQGPGGGKVLMWRSFGSYVEATFLINGITATAKGLPELLMKAQNKGYPYDVIHFTRSGKVPATGGDDNSDPRIVISNSIRDWDSRFAYPRLIMDTPKEFFADLENRYGAKIPTASGDMPDWWADGILTDAKETGLDRVMHNTMNELELWASAASLFSPSYEYPARDITADYVDNYLYDEHTWGAALPALPPENEIFKNKAGRMIAGLKSAGLDRARALYTLARQIGGDANRVIVFNPLGFTRSEAFTLVLRPQQVNHRGDSFVILKDVSAGLYFNGQITKRLDQGGAEAIFSIKDVPPFGWRTYTLVTPLEFLSTSIPKLVFPNNNTVDDFTRRQSLSDPSHPKDLIIDNVFFTSRFSRARGGIISLFDKSAHQELLDPAAKYALGQLVGRKQGPFDLYDLRTPARAVSMAVSADGPVYTAVTIKYVLPTAPFTAVTNEYRFYKHRPYLDLTVTLDHYYNGIGAAKYVVFPFKADAPEVKVEIPYAQMRPGKDQLPGYAKFYAVQHWVNITGADSNTGITWSPQEGPMVEFGKIQKKAHFYDLIFFPSFANYPIITDPPYVFSELMNNYQNTNYHLEQRGSATWHYRISTHPAAEAPSLAGRPGYELAHPLIAVGVQGGSTPRLPDTGSVIQISPDSVTLVTLKRAEDGNGLIARLLETTGQPASVTISSPLAPIRRAALTDIVEKNDQPAQVAAGSVQISMPPFSIRTVRLEF